jgi:hypothetical protein
MSCTPDSRFRNGLSKQLSRLSRNEGSNGDFTLLENCLMQVSACRKAEFAQ